MSFDDQMAQIYVGKYLLVGLTYMDSQGNTLRHEQFHGEIASISPTEGLRIHLRGSRQGHDFVLPADLNAISAAPPGDYHLKETQEVVKNPDLLGTWKVILAPPSSDPRLS